MKKFLVITSLAALTYSCGSTKKAATAAASTPATPEVAATPTPPVVNNNTVAIAAGKETYTAKCGRCHGLKPVANWTADEWVGIMDKMAPKARLTDEEKKNTVAYVNANCKK